MGKGAATTTTAEAEDKKMGTANGEAATPSNPSVADKEAKFMAALQRHVGAGVELTEDKVRETIAAMTPEQRQELMSEGHDLKKELLTGNGHEEELQLFKKELNDRAEKADLPVEQDGDHLTRKVVSFMQRSSDAFPVAYILEAVVSAPYLVKLAIAEARDAAHKADMVDLEAIEAESVRLKVPGWSQEESKGRPPFVRRNLLLISYQMNQSRMQGIQLRESTVLALAQLCAKVRRLLDMLFKFCLQNRWVKAALTVTECQALVLNGMWDMKEDECRELMRERMVQSGLKLPKLSISCLANDCRVGQKVVIQVEVTRAHAYSEEELKAYKATLNEGEDAREGWWVIAESIRSKPNTKYQPGEEIAHNMLVGRQALACTLDSPTMACEIEFEAPSTPGDYKVMVHVRSSGCVGVDVRRKVSFTVLKALPTNTVSSSGSITTMNHVDGDKAAGEDQPPPLEEDGPPPLS
mmetsp:Transcript_20819/g.49882  ORF Transcript_20819/g.49882 Transcript_20819/m.49882 type:complete len:467 (+) Transcript_20819:41-1441(+)